MNKWNLIFFLSDYTPDNDWKMKQPKHFVKSNTKKFNFPIILLYDNAFFKATNNVHFFLNVS